MAASLRRNRPVAGTARLLVVRRRGYRFTGRVRVSAAMTLVVFLVIMGLIPLVWPP
jgi:di/tricarboxylate transporter